jgi:hypothetical protein
MSAQRLAEADGGGGFAFAQRGGGDGGDVDVFAIGAVGQALTDGELNFGFVGAVGDQLFGQQANFGGNLVDGYRGVASWAISMSLGTAVFKFCN